MACRKQALLWCSLRLKAGVQASPLPLEERTGRLCSFAVTGLAARAAQVGCVLIWNSRSRNPAFCF